MAEGADFVMVKPGLPYLDVLRDTANFVQVPIAVYQVGAVSPFINIGLGYMLFTTNSDLKNGNVNYNYWNDGSIRDLPEARFIKRCLPVTT